MKTIENIEMLIEGRVPVIYLVGSEEERYINELTALRQGVHIWTAASGLRTKGRKGQPDQRVGNLESAGAVLSYIMRTEAAAGLYILCDFHPYLANPVTARALKDVAQFLRRSEGKNVIIIAPQMEIPMELEKDVTVINYPLPNREEISAHIERAVKTLEARGRDITSAMRDHAALANAVKGLTYVEIDNALATSLVEFGDFKMDSIAAEKVQIVHKSGLLEMPEVDDEIKGMCSLGGLDRCKAWLETRRSVFLATGGSHDVVDIVRNKIPSPKGMLLLGVQGAGKSHLVKCLAREWGVPLLWLNMGRIFGSRLGESEGRIMSALKTIDSMEPALLFIDEMEKAFSGVQSSSMTDGGTTARVVSGFLTWMQERKSRVFIVATANDISALPVELLRKGRLDEIFFVGLPDFGERRQIFEIHLLNHGLSNLIADVDRLAKLTQGFSGAEIKSLIIEALFDAYADQRAVTANDLARKAQGTKPVSVTRHDELSALIRWAETRCVFASSRNEGAST